MSLRNYQQRVEVWVESCFGRSIASNKLIRNYRFLEEALELVQSAGCTKEQAHDLVEYVFARPIGEIKQEVGGAMTTLASLCFANKIDLSDCAEDELIRCWANIEKIRAKQAAKPNPFSPRP